MKIKEFSVFLLVVATVFSCDSSYSAIMQDFNSNFTQTYYGKETMKFGDLEFEETLMIPKEKYFVPYECSISFAAPLGAVTYSWRLEKYRGKEKTIESIQTERSFRYSFGDNCDLGVPYVLSLEAVDKKGDKFSDETEIILYETLESVE